MTDKHATYEQRLAEPWRLRDKDADYYGDCDACGETDTIPCEIPNCPLQQESVMAEFRNQSDLEFTDITSEQARTYKWPNGTTVTITEPLKLNVSKSGGHRLFDASGVSHYVPAGWIHLSWKAKDGQPHFVT